MQKLAKIALDVPVNKAFDYSITDKMAKPGSRVSVPFGKAKRIGVIIDLLPYCEESQAYKIKSIDRLIDCKPII
ncbi:MAG: primosomal protein N', partial [Gammaproteobacteria bacterium]